MEPREHPIYLLSERAEAAEDCRASAGPDRPIIPVENLPADLVERDHAYAILVIEHRETTGRDAVELARSVGDLPGRETLHVLVADPEGAQPPFASVDAGADDYVADALDGEEFAYRILASDGALRDLADGTSTVATANPAKPLAAAELAPGGDPSAVLEAAAREGARVSGAQVGFVYRFWDDVAVTEGSWGAEVLPRGVVFDLIEDGCLAEVRAGTGTAVRNLQPRALGREQSIVSYIRNVYRSGIAAPLHLGTVVWGALLVGRTSPQPFSENDIAAVTGFAERAAVTIGISERRSRIERLADSDLQTGLLRRDVLERQFRRIRDAGRESVGVAVIQIRGLGELRSSHGRSAAEQLLGEVGRNLTQMNRAGDFQARWDEGEIVWLFDNAEIKTARRATEDAHAILEGAHMPRAGGLQLSVGVAAGEPISCGDLVAHARDDIAPVGWSL